MAFGNRHLNDVANLAVTISNVAVNDGFSERLNAGLGNASAGFAASGDVQLLGAGASNSASLNVMLDTASVGVKAGTATLQLASDGTGTSGFSSLALTSQTVTLSGTVYRLAGANTIAPVNFGAVHVGDVLQRALTVQNTAAADGFSERLNVRFANASDARILLSGNPISGLAAGATDNSSLVVGVDTSSAGNISGFASLILESDGTGTSGLGISSLAAQDVGVFATIGAATVFRLANPAVLNVQPIVFDNHRVGDVVNAIGLNIRNDVPADGFSEGLRGTASSASAGFSATGSFGLLAAGLTDNGSIAVVIDTATAGHRTGTAAISFDSDGSGTSGLGLSALPSQSVELTGDVYRLAMANEVSDVAFGNVHVADVAQRSLSLTNTAAADGFSEALDAALGGSGDISASGVVNLLAAGATNASALVVALDTATAGARSGVATLQFASNGARTSGFAALALPSAQDVNVSGAVYGLAEAEASPGVIAFGTHRVGDVVSAQDISIRNAAAADGFHEGLDAALGAMPAGFQTFGAPSVTNLAAGAQTVLRVALDTSTAGVFGGNAAVGFTSNGTLSGLDATALDGTTVAVSGTVNNIAAPVFAFGSGAGQLSGGGTFYTFDFGSVQEQSGVLLSASLRLTNAAFGPADSLAGAFDLGGAGAFFTLSGFDVVDGLGAGESAAALLLSFNTRLFRAGSYTESIFFDPRSVFAGLDDLSLARIEVRITGRIQPFTNSVPAPAAVWLMLAGFALIGRLARVRTAPR